MKYRITPDLDSAVSGIDLVGFAIDPAEYDPPTTEYYPPGILIEACQTLNSTSGLPETQEDIKYVQSKKFRPYSIPRPNLNPKTEISVYQKITVSNTASFDDIEIAKNVKKISNVSCNLLKLDTFTANAGNITSLNAETFSSKEIHSTLGIFDNVTGNVVTYTNAKIKDLEVDEISATTAEFGTFQTDYAIDTDYFTIENYHKDTTLKDANDLEISAIFKAKCKNISEQYKFGNGYAADSNYENKYGKIVKFIGNGKLYGTSDLQDYDQISSPHLELASFGNDVTDPSSRAIGCITDNTNTIMTRIQGSPDEWKDSDISNHRLFGVSPFGKISMHVSGSVAKFDRLELGSNGKAKKHGSSSTRPVIGIALESGTDTNVNCLVLFSLY